MPTELPEAIPPYYLSEESARADFPVACTLVTYLAVGNTPRKGGIIRTSAPIYGEQETEFAVVAKGTDLLDFPPPTKLVGVYLFRIDNRVSPNSMDLSGGTNLKASNDCESFLISDKCLKTIKLLILHMPEFTQGLGHTIF